jgi:hypothetical protein
MFKLSVETVQTLALKYVIKSLADGTSSKVVFS